ncbi:oxidoreductase [Herbidospora yilanensis]|uniref:oxidoreductase n=1 Tax=Herbidospora yilanensis TaxID=354426 RepID=UPI000784A0C9|nr:NAD-binding protein [Herbidospora yilanensis]
MSERHPHVFSPLELGGLTLRNRVFVSAHTTNFGADFLPTDRHVAYHRERARGGAGLIITEPLRVHDTSLGRAGGLSASPAALPGLAAIAAAVREEGAAVFTQITHTGRHSENVFRRTASWGPSAVPWHTTGPVPHVMTAADMKGVRRAYVAAARLAVEAGFQGLEVHFGHGHLLHQFISPAANTRTDDYGGTEENRLRFPLEVLDDVLAAVGSSALVGVRMSADELVRGGQDLAAGKRIAELLCRTRPIAFLNVSVASYTVPSIGHHVADMNEGRAPYLPQTLAIADVAGSVPVFAACRFVEVGDAERALATGRIAAVAMTRAHIADPHLLTKTAQGRHDEVRPCVSCNFCIGEIAGHRAITCMMNPAAGREAEWPAEPAPAEPARSVLVVGGGPAGMEAARVAAERGHRVRLWERSAELGGQVRTGRRGAGRHELDLLRAYGQAQLARLGVEVRTGAEVTAEDVLAARPDVVVLATGSVRRAPLPLDDRSWAGRTVVVVDREGGWTCASLAETIARDGGRVHVVTPAATPLWGVTEYSRMTALERLRALGVDVWTSCTAETGGGRAVLRSSLNRGETVLDGVTDVIPLDPPGALDTLAADLTGAGLPVHVIGDAVAPRSLLEAVYEGHALARAL